MNKKWMLLPGIAVAFFISSCNNGVGTGTDESADTLSNQEVVEEVVADCTTENAFTVTVKNYEMGDNTDYVFETGNFEVKQSKLTWQNDSVVEFRLSNYEQSELVGDRKDDQVDIDVVLNAKNGKKLEPGIYNYNDWDKDFWSKVTINTSKGTVWFNWVMGMPEQGNISIESITSDKICGTFNLNVEKPDMKMIGVVRLNGTFKVEE